MGRIPARRTPLDSSVAGLAVNVVAGAINGAWCWVLLREGRRRRSPALAADGTHLLTDVITSAGVVVGLVLATLTGWLVLDPLLAALVALNILWSGWKLVRMSIGGLMDEAVPAETLDRIRSTIKINAVGAIEAHDLRTRAAGRITFIEFHLVVPGAMPVSASHAICDRIERALRAEIARRPHHHPRRAGRKGQARRRRGGVRSPVVRAVRTT